MFRRIATVAVVASSLFAAGGAVAGKAPSTAAANQPLALCPDNPHYFLWRGKPTVLIGSGEHYGAVLNRPFDYVKYLDTLKLCGLNHTRLFTGIYVEDNGRLARSPQAGNTLDPAPGQLLCPFARNNVPGYPGGGGKFDLKGWDEAYFVRLKDFVHRASERGIVVEVNLFCPFYGEAQWKLSPFNPANNVNGLGPRRRTGVYTLDGGDGLLPVQEAMVRRIAAALRDSDNIYYEICNEPYFGAVTLPWQRHIADVIVDSEKSLPRRHLISQNIAHEKAAVKNPCAAVSIFNFHYAWPPDAVTMNYDLDKPIGDNETGFRGTADAPYRREAWEFILAGGSLFSHLDYSFTVGHEDGSFALPPNQWGGGSPMLREQLRHLKVFIEGFDFVRMKPKDKVVLGKTVKPRPKGEKQQPSVRALVERGKQYAIYVAGLKRQAIDLEVDLPSGTYVAQWLDPRTGRSVPAMTFSHAGGARRFEAPVSEADLALSIRLRAPSHITAR